MSNTPFSMIKDLIVATSSITYKIYDIIARPKGRLFKKYSRDDISTLEDDDNQSLLGSESDLEEGKEQDNKQAPGFFKKMANLISDNAKKAWDKVAPYVDFFTSNTVCRSISLVGVCLLLINPVSMPFAIAAVTLSFAGVIGAVSIEAYRLYELRKVQNEEKLLHEAKKIDTEQKDLFKDIAKKNPEIIKYFELPKSPSNLTELDEDLKNIKHKFKWKDVIHKSIIGRGPENIASIIYGFTSFNFVSGGINAVSCLLNFMQGAKMQHAFENQMSKLLNDIEVLKTDLNLAYPNGQGAALIKMSSHFKKIDNAGLSAISQHLEKNPNASLNDCIHVFDQARDEAEKKIIMDPPMSFGDKCKEYFHSFKDVIVKGFSGEKTTQMFAPRANRYEENESSKVPEKEKEVSKVNEINKAKKVETIIESKKEQSNVGNKYTKLIEEERIHSHSSSKNHHQIVM